MKKPDSLRAALVAALPELARDPERFLVFIDQGSLHATYVPGLSFECTYTLNIILTDFAADPLIVWVALLAWLSANQPELLDNVDQRRDGIAFEADLLDHAKCDLSIKIKLSESVVVKRSEDGRLDIEPISEPASEVSLPAGHWRLFLRGELLAEWDTATP